MIIKIFSGTKIYAATARAGMDVSCFAVYFADRAMDWLGQSPCLFGYQAYQSEKKSTQEVVILPLRTINCALCRCVVQKQNSTLGLDISERLHEREMRLARRKGRMVGLDSISKGTEMGMWQACVSQMYIKAVCPKEQAVCPCWYFNHGFKWHVNWVFSNVAMCCESCFLFNSPLIHLIMSGRKTHVCANIFLRPSIIPSYLFLN